MAVCITSGVFCNNLLIHDLQVFDILHLHQEQPFCNVSKDFYQKNCHPDTPVNVLSFTDASCEYHVTVREVSVSGYQPFGVQQRRQG
ncbi:4-hydroxy-3-methylbut-2-en-1-yl diphosphate synthase (flavodoxin) [Frankliniella fusca]|uniref:4-hydroxy-3-methylbut-2-en-1-yl diphosphate synthase (Flavodoxin) n=1 Tax=Frankliniella fusca TaxID=407009 RepID=A0AAE1LSP5_9NEOP|nr:4-hydroxy-3-methylbut-2-en-1-yl diphosphate synthase (flavodoxin) [Frankliniella fusca]